MGTSTSGTRIGTGRHRTGLRFGAGFDPFGEPTGDFDRLWRLRRDDDPNDDGTGGDQDDDDSDAGDEDDDDQDDEVNENELPDKLKEILTKERKAARDAKRAQKRAEREARQLREQLKGTKPKEKPKDDDKDDDIEEARRDAERTVTERANRRILKAEVKALAAGKLADPSLAPRLLDLDEFDVDDDGEVDTDAINEAIDELLERTPALAAKPKRRTGDGGGGPRGRHRRVSGAEAGRDEARRRFGDKAGSK